MGEQHQFPQPLPQVTTLLLTPSTSGFSDLNHNTHDLTNESSVPADNPQQLPTLSSPATSNDQRPTFPSKFPHHLTLPLPHWTQSRLIPPPDNDVDALNPGDIGSIPRPTALSQKNLRAAMGLDGTPEAQMYYNKIRVGMFVRPSHSLTCCTFRGLFVGT